MTSKKLLPNYFSSLSSKESRDRYLNKLCYISGKDPYEIPRVEWIDDVDKWPSVTYIHVGMYLLFKQSSYTQESLMNYKSLHCYKHFTNGWVREVLCKEFGENRLLIAKVNHSQRLSEKPLTPWVVCEENGKILAAHCDCMAGLGESCSHVASLLWAIEAGVKKRESLTVTDKLAYWVLPTAVKKIPYARIRDIEFFKSAADPKESVVPSPSAEKFVGFLKNVQMMAPSKPAAFSLIPQFSDPYIPTSLKQDLPPLMTELYDRNLLISASFGEILQTSVPKATDYYKITEVQQQAVEKETREQSNSRLWFRMRTGRVTASKYKMACHTDPANPSQSLIMKICYPETKKFSTEATKWGCKQETTAREFYVNKVRYDHDDFAVADSGLFICKQHAFVGATPDGLVHCKCCGDGICEIKCPFTHKDETIKEAVASDKNFCLEKNQAGSEPEYKLKCTHPYYYQVQAQLMATSRKYCDFVVWTNKSMVVERIYPDDKFVEETLPKAKEFFEHGILPELAAKFYSRVPEPTVCAPPSTDKYCYCGDDEHGTMIACDSEQCPYKWFHLSCLKLRVPPKAKVWFCPECQRLKTVKNKRAKLARQE